MDTAFQGSASGSLSELLDDTLALAQHAQITSKWIENWNTPDARTESLVNIMYQKVSEMEALTKAQVLAPHLEDLRKEIARRKVEWDKCNVELLKGIAFKKVTENETLQKEAQVLLTDVLQKETEIGLMLRKAEDDKLRTESLESQLAEKSKSIKLLEMTVKTLAHRLRETEFRMNISRRRVEADAQSEEASRLECEVLFESFRAAFLNTESRFIQLENELSETPLKSVDSMSSAEAVQNEDWNLPMKSNSDTVVLTEMDLGKHQVEIKRMRDIEQSEEPNVSMKRSVSISNVPAAGEQKEHGNDALDGELEMLRMRDIEQSEEPNVSMKRRVSISNVPAAGEHAAGEQKEQGNDVLDGELEMLTLEQYRDAMSQSTEKKKRLQPDVPEVADEKLIKKKWKF